jgi:hypothetical protein
MNSRREEVLQQLARILESESFQNSRRSKSLLTHLVRSSLDGASHVKERSIAIDVFERGPHYEPAEDSIVRVSVHELRRRLQRYYEHEGAGDHLRIELPQGTYTPSFVFSSAPAQHNAAPPRAKGAPQHRFRALALPTLAAAAVALALWFYFPRQNPFERFWAPILESRNQVILCVGVNAVDPSTSTALARSDSAAAILLAESDQISVPELRHTGVGAAQSLFHFGRLFAESHTQPKLEMVHETSFSRVKSGPTILVGAFNNRWTLEASTTFPFTLVRDGIESIQNQDEKQVWVTTKNAAGEVLEDFAVLARSVRNRERPLVIVAGLTPYGTGAAGRFVTDTASMNQWLAQLAPGWEEMELEAVVRVRVVGGSPGPPEVVTWKSW